MNDKNVTEADLELLAKQFKEDTGVLAPFKDSPADAYSNWPRSNDLWSAWCKGRMRGLAALDAITERGA